MTICNDFVQLAAYIWHYRSEIVDNCILAPFRPLFNPLEVLGYPITNIFHFTLSRYICNDFVQFAANIWHYRSEIVDNWHFGPISLPF